MDANHNKKRADVCRFARVSTDAQDTKDQHSKWVLIEKRDNLNPRWTVEMPGVSGAAVMRSPEMQRLVDIISGGECRGVVMRDCSRIMRFDQFGSLAVFDLFVQHGVLVYTEKRNWDLRNEDDRMMFLIECGINGRERYRIKGLTYGKRVQERAKGFCVSSADPRNTTLPIGVRWNSTEEFYFYDPADIAKVRRLFELFVSGVTNFRELAKLTGISYFVIGDTLSNTAYIGIRTYDTMVAGNVYWPDNTPGKDRATVRYQKKVKRPEDQIERVPMRGIKADPIKCKVAVPEDVFAQAQKMLAVKRDQDWRGSRRAPEDDPYLYRGFLRCACDSRIITLGNGPRQYYACHNVHGDRVVRKDGSTDWRTPNGTCRMARMRREALEPILDRVVMDRLRNEGFLHAALEAKRKAILRADTRDKAAGLKREIEAIAGRQQRLNDLYEMGRYSKDVFAAKAEALDNALMAAQRSLNECVPVVPKISVERLLEICEPFASWDTLDAPERRTLLTTACLVFKVSALGNGKLGAGAQTDIVVNGFSLLLKPDEDGTSGGRIVKARQPRVIIGRNEWDNSEVQSPMVLTDAPLTYIPIPA